MIKYFLKKVFYVNNILRFAQARAIMGEVSKSTEPVIADIGCGDGYLINALDGMYSKYYAIEPTSMHTHIVPGEKVVVLNQTFEELRLEQESIDIVILSSVLQMVENDLLLLSISKNILKRDGKIILSVPSRYILIESLYENFPILAAKFNNIPNSYGEFMQLVNQSYGNAKGFYSLKDLNVLFSELGLEVAQMKYAPGLIMSIIYDISLVCKLLFHRQISTSRSLLVFFPFVLIDNLFFSSRGNELFVVLKKTV